MIPAFIVMPFFSDGTSSAHIFGRVRFSAVDALFVRLSDAALAWEEGSAPEALVRSAIALHGVHALFLNNHQCYYFRMFDGEELEYKYTFGEGDIWASTVRLYNELRDGRLPGYIMAYGDEFQTWDYLNNLFEVPGPPAEQGYISFVPLSTGGYTIKRKWFTSDAMRRGERHDKEPAEIGDFAAYIRDGYVVDAVALDTVASKAGAQAAR